MKKLKQINKAIERLMEGKRVRNSAFKKLIGDVEYKCYLDENADLKRPEEKPKEIKRYSALLQRACYYDYLMEKHGGKYAHIADSAFECAWEYAREIVKTDPSLSMWFDRSVFNDPYSAISSIPRVIGSRSFYCESKNKYPVKQTKNYLKISYLSSSSEELRGANLDDWVIDHPTLKNIKRDFSEFIF